MLLQTKRVLITGGATGIGRAAVKRCTEEGAQVVFGDINAKAGEELAFALNENGKPVFFLETDVTISDSCSSLVDRAHKLMGGIDCLLTAAAIARGALTPIDEFPDEEWLGHLNVNLTGTYYIAKRVVKVMRENGGGVIILIASGAGVTGPSSIVPYGATKGGVNGLGMTLAKQLEPDNVRVNVLCPGNIDTPLKLGIINEQVEKIGGRAQGDTQFSGLGTPEGVSSVIAFLLSNQADYVRGNIFTR